MSFQNRMFTVKEAKHCFLQGNRIDQRILDRMKLTITFLFTKVLFHLNAPKRCVFFLLY